MNLSARAQFTPRDAGRFIAARITPGVIAGVTAASDYAMNAAKAIVPVDTGALRDSITAEVAPQTSSVFGRISAGMSYASYVEYGTGRRGDPSAPYPHVETWPGMVAQPFMRPALDETRQLIRDLMGSQISLALGS